MTLFGKIESYTEIKSAPEKYHGVVSREQYLHVHISPRTVTSCNLCEGDWGLPGTVIEWTVIHDEKTFVSREITEAIDDENNMTTVKVIEGEILKLYKNFKFIIQATPKEGGGSLMHSTIEYEKLNIDVRDPNAIMEIVILFTKDDDDHLQKQA